MIGYLKDNHQNREHISEKHEETINNLLKQYEFKMRPITRTFMEGEKGEIQKHKDEEFNELTAQLNNRLDVESYFAGGSKSSLIDILYYCELQAVYRERPALE